VLSSGSLSSKDFTSVIAVFIFCLFSHQATINNSVTFVVQRQLLKKDTRNILDLHPDSVDDGYYANPANNLKSPTGRISTPPT